MAPLLVLALAALAAAIALAARRGLLALQDSKQDAWRELETQIVKRHHLAIRIIELYSRPMHDEPEALDRAAIAASAVLAAAKAAKVPALAAAEKSYRAAFAALFARADNHPQVAGSAAFASLQQRMATLDARVDERREQYNGAVSVLNFRCDAFPYSVMARVMGLRQEALLP
jgi:LemA protein